MAQQPFMARMFGWPSTVYRREDTGTTTNEAQAAMNASDSYAVASGMNLDLRNCPPLRIALFIEPTPFTHVSGYSTRFKNLIRQLKEAGDEVLVIVPDNDPNAPTEFEGIPIKNVSGFRFPFYNEITLTFGIHGVYNAIKEFKPDVIHSTTPGLSTFATCLFAKYLKIPLLLSYHTHLPIYVEQYGLGIWKGPIWTYLRIQHNLADFTLTTSPQLCEEIIQNGFKRVGLWRKGIDTSVFDPARKTPEMRFKLSDGNPDDPLLVCIGRLGAEKNIKSLRDLIHRFPGVRLAIVGDGPMRKKLEKWFQGTNTYFSGVLHGDELSAAFASADIFVMPSTTETMGFVALESMSSGVPVVAARAGGIPDIVQHGKTGFLFKPNSIDDCEMYVRKLLDDSSLRKEMGATARVEAMKWAWKASAAATRNVGYGRAISNYYLNRYKSEEIPLRLSSLMGQSRKNIPYNEKA